MGVWRRAPNASFSERRRAVRRHYFRRRVAKGGGVLQRGKSGALRFFRKSPRLLRWENEAILAAAVDQGNVDRFFIALFKQKPLRMENIILGNIRDARNPHLYRSRNIEAVLTAAVELSNLKVPRVPARLVLSLEDDYFCRLPFKRAIRFLEEQTELGRIVLVHCYAGHNRSAALVAAYFMRKWGMSALQMMRYFARRRFGCLWNSWFRRQLRCWERHLREIGEKNLAIEAVKVGTYYSENKAEVDRYVCSVYDELCSRKAPRDLRSNVLTKRYRLDELLAGRHGEAVNVFDPFGDAVDTSVSEEEEEEARRSPSPARLVRTASRVSLEEALKAPWCAETAAALMEQCAEGNYDVQGALRLIDACPGWDDVSQEVLERVFCAVKKLYNPAAQKGLASSAKRRFNQAVNRLAGLRHARTPEGQSAQAQQRTLARVAARMGAPPAGAQTRGAICAWIIGELQVSREAASAVLQELVRAGRLRYVQRRYAPGNLGAASGSAPAASAGSSGSAPSAGSAGSAGPALPADLAQVELLGQRAARKRRERGQKKEKGRNERCDASKPKRRRAEAA